MSAAEFVSFSDSHCPGIVIDPEARNEEFWRLVTDAAWDDEWWYDDPAAAQWFDSQHPQRDHGWSQFVREHVAPPQWRWYVWRDDPDSEDQFLEPVPAHRSGGAGTFRAAEVVLR